MHKSILSPIVLASILFVSHLFLQEGESRPYDIDKVERLRWIDPSGRRPMTYEEYLEREGSVEPFEVHRARRSSQKGIDSSLVCVLVNDSLYSHIVDSLSQYAADVEAKGYAVSIFTTSGGEPADLRAFLQGLPSDSLVGAVFIGDLPVAWYEMDEWGYEEFPIDLYYMDLDGDWVDDDHDGIFDGHSGTVEADIWVGRLTASPLSLGGADEVSLLLNYFHRNHRYRTGNSDLPRRALVYIDDDWSGSADDWSGDVGLAYWERTLVADQETTRAGDYSGRLDDGYQWIQVCAHSSPGVHAFKYMSGTQWDYFYNHQIQEFDPRASFYNLFACSNARFVEDDYMGGWYVFNPAVYGLAALGSTKTGSMLYFEEFYGPLKENKPLGEAFKEWFIEVGEESRPWFYGMTLLGDPLLDLQNEIGFLVCAIDDDMAGGSNGNASGTIDPGETVELSVTLRNNGTEMFTDVSSTLTTDDSLVTILDGYEEYGSIDAGSSASSLEDYDFVVSTSCPRGHRIPFTLSVSAENGREWIDGFWLVVEDPLISHYAHLIVDTISGNGDGDADPGETVEMSIVLANTGVGSEGSVPGRFPRRKISGVSAELSSGDSEVTVIEGSGQFGNLMPGDTARSIASYRFSLDSGCPDYHLIRFTVQITADGWYSSADSFYVAVGDNCAVLDDIESGVNGWTHYEITPGYVDEWHLSSQRNHTLEGNTSWKCGDSGSDFYSDFMDAGLVTPEVELGENGVLTFWHWIDAETASDTSAWDGAVVEMYDGGEWVQIEPLGGYPYVTVGGAEGPFSEGTPCFSGCSGWSNVEFDLSSYSGIVRFRFRFGSDVGTAKEGWYLDDVMVWSVVYACGDCNGDGRTTIADATYLTSFIYRNGPESVGSGDVNLDGRVTVADATYLSGFIYRSGSEPCNPPLSYPSIVE